MDEGRGGKGVRGKAETLITRTPVTVARIEELASHDRSKPEPPSKRPLQCLWGRSQQAAVPLLKTKAQSIDSARLLSFGVSCNQLLQYSSSEFSCLIKAISQNCSMNT